MASTAVATVPAASQQPLRGWLGRLRLGYALRHARTRLVLRRHEGPLLVQRCFHPEGAVCHSYVLHPPGGVVGGDRLSLEVTLDVGARALITTPAATKFYRTGGGEAVQSQSFAVADGAALEVLPAETILHGGSRVRLDSRVRLAGSARFCYWDVLCLGRPGSGDHYRDGRCTQSLWLERDGLPLLHERLALAHGDPLLRQPWGLAGQPVAGLLVASPATGDLAAALREALGAPEGLRLGLTVRDGVLLLRCLGPAVEPVRMTLQRAWTLLRQAVIGLPACAPRIWRT